MRVKKMTKKAAVKKAVKPVAVAIKKVGRVATVRIADTNLPAKAQRALRDAGLTTVAKLARIPESKRRERLLGMAGVGPALADKIEAIIPKK